MQSIFTVNIPCVLIIASPPQAGCIYFIGIKFKKVHNLEIFIVYLFTWVGSGPFGWKPERCCVKASISFQLGFVLTDETLSALWTRHIGHYYSLGTWSQKRYRNLSYQWALSLFYLKEKEVKTFFNMALLWWGKKSFCSFSFNYIRYPFFWKTWHNSFLTKSSSQNWKCNTNILKLF